MEQPTSREVTIKISPENYTLIDEASGGKGAETAITTLVEVEARRIWHVNRCKPKPPVEARPVGRPRISPEQRRGMEAWEILEGIFDKLAKFKGEAFERLHGEQKRRAVEMYRVGDWQGLEKFLAERGWEKP